MMHQTTNITVIGKFASQASATKSLLTRGKSQVLVGVTAKRLFGQIFFKDPETTKVLTMNTSDMFQC